MSDMITADLVDLDLAAQTKQEAARSLAARMVALGRVTDLDGFLADVAAREAQMPTGLDGGIGIPHCRSAHVTEPTLAFGRAAHGIDFGAADGPADLVFLIAAPEGADDAHLTILSSLARSLMDPEFTAALRATASAAEAAALLRGEEPPAEAGAADPDQAPGRGKVSETAPTETAGTAPADETPAQPFRIVAVTSCPTGIAHTYMAAEALEQAGRDAGVEVSVETQGSAGFLRLDPALIAAADGVILAHDIAVREKERFAGKPTVDVGVKAGVNRAAELIAEVREKAARGETTAPAGAVAAPGTAAPVDREGAPGEGYGARLRAWLMSGVSYMVPFVAAGGLLIALGFAIGGWDIDKAPSVAEHFAWGRADSWAALMFQTGGLAFGFLVPVLAGYIAYGMADRPGLVPGFVGGAVALTIDAGFLGGLAAGLLAGAVVRGVQRLRVPSVLRGIMPVVVIPLVASAVVGFLMFLVVGKPIAALQGALTDWLSGLGGANAVLLGALLGLMMCFDLGGPVNKVAYAFAVGGLTTPNEGSLKVMAAVMAAGMVPPLAMALATTVRGRLFTRAERENGKAAWVLGASFISEGAIPFAAADPLRVIPSAMAGGAVTGALSMAFEATLRAPHGGVFVVPLIGNPFPYLAAVLAGTVVSAALVIALKSARKRPRADGEPAPSTEHEAPAPA
ncbi:PTS fructose transporter subunit IIABC [Streptomyces thermolilacinus]|uniref:PTS lactose transporter subunit IIC n=1 Tax=Streptomyces thermolilacinus SPC6 TaxID=1306406 RepID=A0A1D3DU12_9ACTN|nr:fructose-specific PTS transporter subunit EIIC [Streptomyces thermolilacinus]OEJ95824.1 PTS lactose transporter subunit IIC [Streptomyces thermolilacinus SPC6]